MPPAGSGPRPALNATFLTQPGFNVLEQAADDVDDTRENWMKVVHMGCVPTTRPCRSSRGAGFRDRRAVHGVLRVEARSTALGFGFLCGDLKF